MRVPPAIKLCIMLLPNMQQAPELALAPHCSAAPCPHPCSPGHLCVPADDAFRKLFDENCQLVVGHDKHDDDKEWEHDDHKGDSWQDSHTDDSWDDHHDDDDDWEDHHRRLLGGEPRAQGWEAGARCPQWGVRGIHCVRETGAGSVAAGKGPRNAEENAVDNGPATSSSFAVPLPLLQPAGVRQPSRGACWTTTAAMTTMTTTTSTSRTPPPPRAATPPPLRPTSLRLPPLTPPPPRPTSLRPPPLTTPHLLRPTTLATPLISALRLCWPTPSSWLR